MRAGLPIAVLAAALIAAAPLITGCAKSRPLGCAGLEPRNWSPAATTADEGATRTDEPDGTKPPGGTVAIVASHQESAPVADGQPPLGDTPGKELPSLPSPAPELLAGAAAPVSLERVIASVQRHYPVIRAAAAARGIAAGEALAALGEFDHKLKAASENQPLGFYNTYRQQIAIERNTFWGGSVVGGYRIGRGDFEPWYLERETNAGGEFKAGLIVPLAQNRWIDPNRAALWQAQIERNRVEPEIRTEVILAVRDASLLYWGWLAAGENYRIAQELLDIAVERNLALEKQIEAGELPQIVLVDNRRIIVSREAKLIDAERKLEQSAIQLSLFLRTASGAPWVPSLDMLPERFPIVPQVREEPIGTDIDVALRSRPELLALNLLRRQIEIELEQARNMSLPEVNAALLGSQDVGEPTKELRDKSQFELEAGITLDVPLQRRRAVGKIRATQAKLAELQAKTQFQSEKIVTEVQIAQVAMEAAGERVERMRESLELSIQVEIAERRAFALGDSNLLNVNLREQQRADAALELVAAQLDYFLAQSDFEAARGAPFVQRP